MLSRWSMVGLVLNFGRDSIAVLKYLWHGYNILLTLNCSEFLVFRSEVGLSENHTPASAPLWSPNPPRTSLTASQTKDLEKKRIEKMKIYAKEMQYQSENKN